VLELPNNPLGLERDDLVFEKAKGTRTAALLANVAGSPLVTVDVGGKFGRDLAAQGEAAMTAFALDWLGELFGADLRKAVKRMAATQWNNEPWVLGAVSAAAPGAQPQRRILIDTLLEPVRGRLWLAGEAVHETLWGTVAGARRAVRTVRDRRGLLRVFEKGASLPFALKRCYVLSQVPKDAARGEHATICDVFLAILTGRCRLTIRTARRSVGISLSSRSKGV